MKLKKTVVVCFLVIVCFILAGCQSEDARLVDGKILELSSKKISLDLWEEIDQIQNLDAKLTQKERDSLKNISEFEKIVEEYTLLENAEIERIEEMISELPDTNVITVSSEKIINDVSYAYEKSTEAVKNRISNSGVLEAAKARLEQVKIETWVKCSSCGGSGETSCAKCGGSGSRPAYHTTPNGKTWLVSQDCATRQTCTACGGAGGKYSGQTEEIESEKWHECIDCEGSGRDSCINCNGRGKVMYYSGMYDAGTAGPCSMCDQRGYYDCETCNGSGGYFD